jgi:D-alanyl-D-alanine carboxypeptidase/D-alanyl-D-alanine-endopeptidase (penicillin-binding protein 4)
VSGKLPADQTFLEAFALPKPDQSAARFLGSSVVATDSVPLRSPDWTESSRPLGEMVRHCLTMSDNFYAENFLLLTAAREKAVGRENAWQTAADQASKWLQNEVKWKGALPRIDDGSGLSRQNYVSASGFAQLLLWARSRSWFKQYYDCLVTPGSGTLKGRLPGSTFHGKTGTLSGVQSLSGYVVDANGKQLIISVIVNNSSANTQKLRDVLDKFVIQCESGIIDGTNFASSSNSYAVHARTVPFTRSYSVAIHRSR